MCFKEMSTQKLFFSFCWGYDLSVQGCSFISFTTFSLAEKKNMHNGRKNMEYCPLFFLFKNKEGEQEK